jgi:Na+/proline symporter
MGMHVADLAALLGYFVLIGAIGVWSARHVRTMGDFIMPRRFGKTMMLFFGFGTGTHSDQAVAVAAKTFTSGASGIWYQWLWLLVTPFYWLLAPAMRRFRALTTADVFELRYNRSVAMLFAVVGLLQYSVTIGVMLKGSAHVLDASTGGLISAGWAIPLMTVMFVSYGVAGGLHAAILTDFLQGLLTILFSFLLLPLILNAIGGMPALRSELPANMLSLVAPDGISAFYITMIAINGLVGVVAQPHCMANCAAGRVELDGQVGFMCGALLKRVCTIAWTLTGLAAIVYFARLPVGEINPDEVFGLVAHEFLPHALPGLLGLFIAGLLASVMSSCDAFMISASGLFAENIYKPLRPGRTDRHYLWAARWATLGVVAAGVVFSYRLQSVVDGLEVFWKIGPAMGIAFWLGMFWRGMTTAGAWASTLSAFGVMLAAESSWLASQLANTTWARELGMVGIRDGQPTVSLPWQMTCYLLAGIVVGVVVSLFTSAVRQERLDRYYALIRTPIVPGEIPGPPCELPPGVEPPPARKLIPLREFEILMPSRSMVAGFLAGWVAAGALIGVFVWLLR